MSRFAPLSSLAQQLFGRLVGVTLLLLAACAVLVSLVLFFTVILAVALCERTGWALSQLGRFLGHGRAGVPAELPRR